MSEQKLKEKEKKEYEEERRRRKELERKRREKQEEERTRRVSEIEITEPDIQKTAETVVEVPILKLEKPKIEVKEVKVSKEISHIEREELEVKVPIIKLSTPIFEEREVKSNKDIPSVEPIEKKELKIPPVKLKKASVKCVISEFNSTIPEVRPRPRARIRIPIYRILKPPMIREISLFDEKIDEKLLEKLEEEKIQTPKPQVSVISKEAEPSLGEGEEIEEEPPEILESIFGVSKSSLFSGGAKLIWVPVEEFLGTIRYICWKIYREIKGGKAEPKIISDASKESFKREIENWMKAEDRVFSVEFKESEELDKEFWESVMDRIEELFGQDIGFIVTNKKILFIPRHHIVDEVDIKVPENVANDKKLQAELCSLMWGFIKPNLLLEETKNLLDQVKFDHVFEMGRKLFERKIKSIGEPYLSVTKRHRSLKESDDMHYPLKVFVVKYMADMLGLEGIKDVDKMKQFIHTEETFNKNKFGMDEITYPDIYVDTSAQYFADEVFEIETLFGEGEYSIKKIDETIEKYEKIINTPTKVNIVIENLTFLMHLKDLIKKKKIHQKLKAKGKRKFELEFWTLDVQNSKLMPLEEVVRRVKSLYTKFPAPSLALKSLRDLP